MERKNGSDEQLPDLVNAEGLCVAAVSDLAPPERRGEAINVGSLAVYLGLAFGPFLGETVLGVGSYTAVWLAAATMAAAATLIVLLVPETAPVLREFRSLSEVRETALVLDGVEKSEA